MTKVDYIKQLHNIVLLQFAEFEYFTVYVLIKAYMNRFNVMFNSVDAEDNFLKTGHDTVYYDLQHFAILCEMYMDFSKAGTMLEQIAREIPEIFPQSKAA